MCNTTSTFPITTSALIYSPDSTDHILMFYRTKTKLWELPRVSITDITLSPTQSLHLEIKKLLNLKVTVLQMLYPIHMTEPSYIDIPHICTISENEYDKLEKFTFPNNSPFDTLTFIDVTAKSINKDISKSTKHIVTKGQNTYCDIKSIRDV